jgi:hypothetical protein
MDETDCPCSEVSSISDISRAAKRLDALVLAAGFEERAFKFIASAQFRSKAHCILIRFRNEIPGNKVLYRKFLNSIGEKFAPKNIHIVELKEKEPQRFEKDLSAVMSELPRDIRRFGVDVSGMPSYAICLALKTLRDHRSDTSQLVIYTVAKEYNPSRPEYEKLIKQNPDEIELIPESMALEMDEILVLDSFSGYRSQNAKSCLAIFAGYEAHRSNGVVEAINPALLLLIYGLPGDNKLAWRLDLSKKLHRKFEKGRMTATEITSTLHVRESLEVLDRYYNYLIDDYDFVLSPISSKMNVIATYLFWERYGEVQLTFPLPIGYDPAKRPRGTAKTYVVELYPRRQFFRI